MKNVHLATLREAAAYRNSARYSLWWMVEALADPQAVARAVQAEADGMSGLGALIELSSGLTLKDRPAPMLGLLEQEDI